MALSVYEYRKLVPILTFSCIGKNFVATANGTRTNHAYLLRKYKITVTECIFRLDQMRETSSGRRMKNS